ncbi:MAG TPA: MBL fold metallo-hydrolase [Candidatus Limnocylindrales bacterium]|nr:MBL fold metallo-hydrolase [Candidatus Limnocylindrales bacterium]
MTLAIDVSRRSFLVNASRGTIAIAVLGVAGCGPSALSSAASSASSASQGSSPSGAGSAGSASASAGGSSGPPPSTAAGSVTWERADLGFVSAYVLARAGEAAIVDTGLPGSEATIHKALTAAGLDWGNVGHVILTHRHGDHVGSIDAVLAAASGATAYAGEADLASITSPRSLIPVKDGDMVFGLRIVATPGHTIGHVSVLDEAGGILVAGDALSTRGGHVGDSNPAFTDDMDQALASIRKLGTLTFETLLVGHGDPILEGASARVAAFAAGS